MLKIITKYKGAFKSVGMNSVYIPNQLSNIICSVFHTKGVVFLLMRITRHKGAFKSMGHEMLRLPN